VRELYRNNDVQESTVCTYVRSDVVLTSQDVLFQNTYIFLLLYVKATRKVSYMLYKQHLWESCTVNDVQESTACTYVRSGVVLTTPDVLFQNTYIFLLWYVRATRKVSYMLYKVHWWESCTVTTTFKKVLYARMYVRVSCSPPQTFYSKIPIYSCSYMSGLLEKYHICCIRCTGERVVP